MIPAVFYIKFACVRVQDIQSAYLLVKWELFLPLALFLLLHIVSLTSVHGVANIMTSAYVHYKQMILLVKLKLINELIFETTINVVVRSCVIHT